MLLRAQQGEVQFLAYFTLVGRIDQFILGILAWHWRKKLVNQHALAALCLLLFTVGYAIFDSYGGFMRMPKYPSPSLLWVFLPTLEGLAYAAVIAWYDSSFSPADAGFSRFLGKLGTYSYSIYLLHFFFVFDLARWIHTHVMDLSNFYIATAWSLALFMALLPMGALCFRCIESPWLSQRRKYLRQ